MTSSMNFDITATESASREFLQAAAAAEKLEQKLERLDGMTVEAKADLNIDPARRKIDQLNTRLKALQNVRAKVEIDGAEEARRTVTALVVEMRKIKDARATVKVDTRGALTDLVAIEAAATEIDGSTPTVRPEVDDKPTLAGLAKIRTEVESLNSEKLQIQADATQVTREILQVSARLDELRKKPTSVEVEAEIAKAMAELTVLDVFLKKLTTRQNKIDVSLGIDVDSLAAGGAAAAAAAGAAGGLGDALTDAASAAAAMVGKTVAVTAAAAGLTIGAGGSTAALLTLGGSLVQIAGTAPVAVAGLTALKGVALLLEAGLDGVGAAMTAETPEAYAKALAKLTPGARGVVQALRPMRQELMQLAQESLFKGLGDDVERLSGTYLPKLKTATRDIGAQFNLAGVDLIKFARSGDTVRDVETILRNTTAAVEAGRPSILNLATAYRDVAAVGSEALPELAKGWTDSTAKVRDFVAHARETGQLREWIGGGVVVLQRLGNIGVNTGRVLFSMWTAARDSGADFLKTVDEGVARLSVLMESASTQNSLVTFFRETHAAIEAMAPGVERLTLGVFQAVGAFSNTGSLREFGATVGEIAGVIGDALPRAATLASNTLGSLSESGSNAVSVLGPLVTTTLDLANATGPVAPTVIGMIAAYAGMTKVAGWVGSAGNAMGGLVTRMGASEAAGNRVSSVIGRIGGSLPVLGAGLVLASAGWDALTTSSTEGAAALEKGGAAAAAAVRDLAAQGLAIDMMRQWGPIGQIAADGLDLITDSTDDLKAGLDSVGLAQLNAAQAASRYQAAIQSGDPTRIAQAQKDYATAVDGVAAAQAHAAQETMTASDRMREQAGIAQSLISSHLAVEESLQRVIDAESALNNTEPGTKAAEAAARAYVQTADQAASAVGRLAEAQARANGAADPAAEGAKAYGAALLQLAAEASPRAQAALFKQLSTLDQVTLNSLSAAAATSGFATKIIELPNGKTITVAVDPETGKIISTKELIDSIESKSVTVTIAGDEMPATAAFQRVMTAVQEGQPTIVYNGEPLPALEALRRVSEAAGLADATVTIGGQTFPADAALQGFITAVQTGNPMVNINGQDVDARAVYAALVATIQTPASVPIDGEPSSFFGKLGGAVAAASVPATMPIDGNPSGANASSAGARAGAQVPATMPIQGNPAAVNATQAGARAGVQQPATMPIQGNPADANAKSSQVHTAAAVPSTMPIKGDKSDAQRAIDSLPRLISAVYRVTRVLIGFAGGGIYQPMADGGVIEQTSTGVPVRAYAGGGRDQPDPGKYDGHQLRPMSGSRAAAVPPRTYRVVGDNTSSTEVYIPLNGSKSSLAFTGYAAAQQGYGLTPLRKGARSRMSTSSAGSSTPRPAVSMDAARSAAGRSLAVSAAAAGAGAGLDLGPFIGAMSSELRAVRAAVLATGPDGGADVVAELRALRSQLATLTRGNVALTAQSRRSDGELSRV